MVIAGFLNHQHGVWLVGGFLRTLRNGTKKRQKTLVAITSSQLSNKNVEGGWYLGTLIHKILAWPLGDHRFIKGKTKGFSKKHLDTEPSNDLAYSQSKWVFPKIVVFTPQIIHFNRVFHYKPSILGYHYFWKHSNSSMLYYANKKSSIFILQPLPASISVYLKSCWNNTSWEDLGVETQVFAYLGFHKVQQSQMLHEGNIYLHVALNVAIYCHLMYT